MTRPRLSQLLIVTALTLVVAGLLFPIFANVKEGIPIGCLGRLRSMSNAMLQYVGENDDHFPRRDIWMDIAQRSERWAGTFHCPNAPIGAFGYAFNGALDGVTESGLADPMTTPLLYDSVNPIRKASDLVRSLPSPGRHEGCDNLAYVDGLVKSVVVK